MPSYKQKEKCKNSDSGGSDTEVTDSLWNVQYSDSDSEDSNEGKRLTSLVRESYVKHLRQILKNNYEAWCKSQTEETMDSSYVYHWATVLEQKALRACMVAELYQKSMISLISEIKKNTAESKLYIKQNNIVALEKLLPKEIEIQTDVIATKQYCDVETQTVNKVYSSLLEMPLPKCDRTSSPAVLVGQPILTIDQLRDCVAKVSPVPRNVAIKSPFHENLECGHNFNEKLSASGIMSPVNKSGSSDSKGSSEPANCLNSSGTDLLTLPNKQMTSVLSSDPFSAPTNVRNRDMTSISGRQLTKSGRDKANVFSVTKQENANQLSESEFLADLEHEIQSLSENRPLNDVSINESSLLENGSVQKPNERCIENEIKDSLDARLTAMGLLDDAECSAVQSPNKESKGKSNWHAEYIAQSCNLTRILSRLSNGRRKYVQRKMLRLFGPVDEPLVEMCEENVTVCRKRIASVVVNELTPLYQNKRISSKYLFKRLAKRLTASLMETSYAPESRYVKKCVHEFFRDKKCISSDKDITLV